MTTQTELAAIETVAILLAAEENGLKWRTLGGEARWKWRVEAMSILVEFETQRKNLQEKSEVLNNA